MTSVEIKELDHIIRLIKQKFISPFKIIYMIDQKQADHFKSRNQNAGCCTATEITIAPNDQTKIQKLLAEMITPSYLKNVLPQLLQYCQDRYKNIIEKSKEDSLKVTNQVQKYLIDNILAESVNKYIFNKLISKLAKQSNNLSTQIGLWATPATWKSKYPHIELQLFQSKNLYDLFNKGFTVIQNKFDSFIIPTFQQINLLQKIGKFQQIVWELKQKQKQHSNQIKILRNPLDYVSVQIQNNRFKNLSRICILLQSIPFQLNMKANSYLTVTDAIQVYYYNDAPFQNKMKNNISKFQIIVPVNIDLKIQYKNQVIVLKAGSIGIIEKQHQFSYTSSNHKNNSFIIKSFVNEAKRIN